MVWRFEYKEHKRLVVINYTNSVQLGRVKIQNVSGSGKVKLVDLMTDRVFERDADELRNHGIACYLKPYQGEIFEYK